MMTVDHARAGLDLETLTFDERGLLPVVAQDEATGAVLMVAWADREAIATTLASGEAPFWSRSRRKLWKKGESSGNILQVIEIRPDCDRDTLLYVVRTVGPACHRGTRTCFEPNPARLELGWLYQILESRRQASPEASYTARLLAKGRERVAQKVGEEGVETVIAGLAAGDFSDAADQAGQAFVGEASDLIYHLLVLLLERGVGPERLAAELRDRHAHRNPSQGER